MSRDAAVVALAAFGALTLASLAALAAWGEWRSRREERRQQAYADSACPALALRETLVVEQAEAILAKAAREEEEGR